MFELPENLSRDASHTLGLMAGWLKHGDTVLDIGCGKAEIGYNLEKIGFDKVYNIDFVDIREFQVKNFSVYDGVYLPFDDSFFDFISINFVLHHIPNVRKPLILDEIKRVSRGLVFILEDTPKNLFDRLCSGFHGYEYRHRIKSRESFGFYTQEEWKNLFRSSGWEVLSCEPQKRLCRSRRQPFARTLFVVRAI